MRGKSLRDPGKGSKKFRKVYFLKFKKKDVLEILTW